LLKRWSRESGEKSSTQAALLWLMVAIAVVAAYALPLLTFVRLGAQYLSYANESLAYRYFVSVRILSGEGESAWLPQGQLVTLLQHGIILWLTKISGMSSSDIEHTLQPFSLASCTLMTIMGSILLVYGMTNRRFMTRDKILVAFAALGPIFVLHDVGLYYSTLPDYYFMTMVLALAYVVLFIRLERMERPVLWQDSLWIGLFCGASLSNKITLASLAGVIAVQVAIGAYRNGLKQTLLCLLIFEAAAVVGFIAIFLGVYLGRVTDVVEVIRHWYDFGSNAGQEVGFERFLNGLFWRYNYDLVLFGFLSTFLFSTAMVTIDKCRRPSRALLLCAIAAMAAFVFYAVYRRSAGTTLYEAAVLLTAMVAMGLTMLPSTLSVKFYTVILGCSALIYALFTFQSNYDRHQANLERSRRITEMAWQIHAATKEIEGPWVLLIPDDSYVWGGVEELIVKGTSDFGWNEVAAAKWIRDRVAPGMAFRRWPDLFDENRVFLWITKSEDGDHFVKNSVSDPNHHANWQALEVRATDSRARCQSWTPQRRVTLCVLASNLAD
jgi:hypothetical protein